MGGHMNIQFGNDFKNKLAKALGLDSRPIQRIVIDVPCDGIVKVYVKEVVQQPSADNLIELIELSGIEPTIVEQIPHELGEAIRHMEGSR